MWMFAVVVVILAYFVHWYLQIKSRMCHWKKLPCKRSTVLFGELRDFVQMYTRKNKYPAGVYFLERILSENRRHQREGLNAFWLGLTPLVTVFCPELAEKLLGNAASLDRSFNYDFYKQWLGVSLITSTGSKWRGRRKLLSPCFHSRLLEEFVPAFDEQSRVLVSKLEQRRGEEPVLPLIALCTLDIVCETVMGAPIGAQKGQNLEYTAAVESLGDYLNQRIVKPWLQSDFLFNLSRAGRAVNRDMRTMQDFIRNVVQQKKEAVRSKWREASPEGVEEVDGRRRRQALMDLLLDLFFQGGQLTEEEIQEEVLAFMFAGHETTAAGVAFALYCVGLHPAVQGRLHEELDAIFEGDDGRAVTTDDARRMRYMECVLKESQRMYPSVPIVGRKIAEDIKYNGFVIPSGTDVYVNIMSLHRHPDSFPLPEVFDPDRFLPENALQRHPYAYVPFSAGPRNCIGQKFALIAMKVIVANILRRFRVASLDPRVRVKVEITLKPAQPLRLQFLPRTHTSSEAAS